MFVYIAAAVLVIAFGLLGYALYKRQKSSSSSSTTTTPTNPLGVPSKPIVERPDVPGTPSIPVEQPPVAPVAPVVPSGPQAPSGFHFAADGVTLLADWQGAPVPPPPAGYVYVESNNTYVPEGSAPVAPVAPAADDHTAVSEENYAFWTDALGAKTGAPKWVVDRYTAEHGA